MAGAKYIHTRNIFPPYPPVLPELRDTIREGVNIDDDKQYEYWQ
jgi:hypothetical protein